MAVALSTSIRGIEEKLPKAADTEEALEEIFGKKGPQDPQDPHEEDTQPSRGEDTRSSPELHVFG